MFIYIYFLKYFSQHFVSFRALATFEGRRGVRSACRALGQGPDRECMHSRDIMNGYFGTVRSATASAASSRVIQYRFVCVG